MFLIDPSCNIDIDFSIVGNAPHPHAPGVPSFFLTKPLTDPLGDILLYSLGLYTSSNTLTKYDLSLLFSSDNFLFFTLEISSCESLNNGVLFLPVPDVAFFTYSIIFESNNESCCLLYISITLSPRDKFLNQSICGLSTAITPDTCSNE